MACCKLSHSPFHRRAAMLSLAAVLLCAPGVHAQQSAPPTAPPDVARAESLRREADALHEQAEASLARDEAACLTRWLVNYCRDNVRERYLQQQQKHRALNAQAAVIEQDIRRRELAEREALLAKQRAERAAELRAQPAGAAVSGAAAKPTPPRPTAAPLPAASPPRAAAPTAKPLTPAQRADREIELLSARALRDQEAALRAQKARETAARYEKRRAEVAARKAKRGATDLPPLQQQGSDALVKTKPASNGASGVPAIPPPPPAPGDLPNIPPPPPVPGG